MKALLLALLPVITLQAAAASVQPPTDPAPVKAADQATAVDGSNAFAVDLYSQLRAQPGNLFFSPESISTAFAMAYAGAEGQTAVQMARTLHFTLPPDRLHPAMGALLAAMNAPHQNYELRVADALWAQQDASFKPGYLKLTASDYGAGFHRVDFKTSPEAARITVNQWIEQQTNNRIQNLLQPGVVTPATRLILTNAIYFKGDWLDAFNKTTTEDEDFHVSSSQTVKTPLMHRTGSYRYYSGGSCQVLEMPYKGDELSMMVVLPNDTDGLSALEKSFTAAAAKNWIAKLAPVDRVILTFPRFTMTQQFELSGVLSGMGMPQAFSGTADFSGMTGKPEFSISAAIHKAYIDVNETGTEAAAATSVIMRTTAARMPMPEPPPVVFRADHPFLFFIRDMQTDAILFLGRVEDPTK